ncbi:hypothetical protein GEMRC1_004079 [Eukaryota sp. GEM-RC1]
MSSFLLSRDLTIFTDHRNLAFLISAPEKNRVVKRWIHILSEFQFSVIHTIGEDNHWADMLSRNIETSPPENINLVTSCPEPMFSRVDGLCRSDDDMEYQSLTSESINMISEPLINKSKIFDAWLSKVRSTQVEAKNNNDVLFQHPTAVYNEELQLFLNSDGKILIPVSLRKTTPFPHAGHPSLRVSIDRLNSSDYFWPKMAKDMKKHCMQCPACQKTAPLAKLKIKPSGNLWADKPFAKNER